jgi:hypothetical protein
MWLFKDTFCSVIDNLLNFIILCDVIDDDGAPPA